MLVLGGEARFLMAVPEAGCGEKTQGSHGSPDAGFGGGRCIGSHGSPRHWFGGRWGFSWQSQTLVVVGSRRGFSFQIETLVVEGGDVLVLMAVIDAGCGGGGGVSHGSRRCWLWGGKESQGFSWQSKTLVVGW